MRVYPLALKYHSKKGTCAVLNLISELASLLVQSLGSRLGAVIASACLTSTNLAPRFLVTRFAERPNAAVGLGQPVMHAGSLFLGFAEFIHEQGGFVLGEFSRCSFAFFGNLIPQQTQTHHFDLCFHRGALSE